MIFALAAVWVFAVPFGPEACALSLPGPRNCWPSDRLQAAIFPTLAIISATVISFALLFAFPRSSRVLTACSVILLLAMAVASYVHVAWIPALAWSWRPRIGP